MISSVKYSFLVLRIGLAIVFFWFGVDKFFHPGYWITTWIPGGFVTFLESFGVSGVQFVYLMGIFEVLIGLSLLSGVFIKFFSGIAIILILAELLIVGVTEITVRDFGILGGLLAVILLPDRITS